MIRRTLLGVALVASLGACGPATPSSPPAAERSPDAHPVTTTERWRLALPSDQIGIPEVTADEIYVTTADSVVAVRHDGTGEWSAPIEGGARIYAPRVDGDVVFVAGENALVAVRRSSGDTIWRFDTSERVNRPAVMSGVVVATTSGGRVFALDKASGAVRWDASIATESNAQPAVVDGVAVVVGIAEWAGFDVADGHQLWSGDLGIIGTSSPAVAPSEGGPLAVVASENKLIAVGLHDGQLRWEARAGQSELAQVPTVDHARLLVPDHWGRLTAYAASNGTELWKVKGVDGVALWGEPVPLGNRRVALAVAKDGPRIASPAGALALRPPAPGLGVARLPDGALVVSTWGKGQNYLVAYDLDLGA